MAATELPTRVWRSGDGWSYVIGSGESAVSGWTRHKGKVKQMADAYLRRRGGELMRDDKGRVLIKVSGPMRIRASG